MSSDSEGSDLRQEVVEQVIGEDWWLVVGGRYLLVAKLT